MADHIYYTVIWPPPFPSDLFHRVDDAMEAPCPKSVSAFWMKAAEEHRRRWLRWNSTEK